MTDKYITMQCQSIVSNTGIVLWKLLSRGETGPCIRKSLPVHSFNAVIIPILRGCLQSLFNIPVPWYLFDTVLKVTSWPAFVSRCIIDAYFSFYGLVLDIDMNCGCRLYRSSLTYAMDCLLNSITGMNVDFLLTVSPPYTQLWLSQTD